MLRNMAKESLKRVAAKPKAPNKKKAIERAIARLRESRLKVTTGRTALLEYLVDHHGPFRIEYLHKSLGADTVTVYRNLASLEEIGLVARVDFGDGVARYEFRDPDDHHHHVVCRSCDKVEAVDLCPFEFLDKQLKKMGYAGVEHSANFFAICPKCQTTSAARVR